MLIDLYFNSNPLLNAKGYNLFGSVAVYSCSSTSRSPILLPQEKLRIVKNFGTGTDMKFVHSLWLLLKTVCL